MIFTAATEAKARALAERMSYQLDDVPSDVAVATVLLLFLGTTKQFMSGPETIVLVVKALAAQQAEERVETS